MQYNRCSEVDEKFWLELTQTAAPDILRRTGVRRQQQVFRVPYFNRELVVDPDQRHIFLADRAGEEPGFRRCLTILMYLLRMDTAALGPPISPLELPGATMFFQQRGPHALPSAPLEERFGRDLAGFLQTGRSLGAAKGAGGDAALSFQVFPQLPVGVILWQADDEFPAQVSFTVPSQLHLFWQLDAVLGLLGVVVKEVLGAASPGFA